MIRAAQHSRYLVVRLARFRDGKPLLLLGAEDAALQRYHLSLLTSRSIWLIASSQPTGLSIFGLPILLMLRHGQDLYTSPL